MAEKKIETAAAKEARIELTAKQKEELNATFGYSEKASYTPDEEKLLKKMFDTPEKLLLLRKALMIFTAEERGLTYVSPQSLVQASITDLHAYAIETAVNNLAEEKVRNGLFNLYRFLKVEFTADKKAEFEKQNIEDFEEEQRKEQFEEAAEAGTDKLGENL